MSLKLYNSLSAQKEEFIPYDKNNIRMYVCGPTVYDRPHIGNARAVVVYDILFRILKQLYGENVVKYARNITDVDDKINAAAKANGETIHDLTKRITDFFHADMDALNNLRPTVEPRATGHIKQIITLIEKIISNGHAYVKDGHVLFDIESISNLENYKYGDLSGKKLEDLIAGARIEVESYKKNAGDFVLWKPAAAEDDESSKFESPWGVGRPGWHIECSAMSTNILGNDFDIHGGGADLKFPHHENEIAQSLAAHHHSHYAKYWVHNGFVTVNGEKMSKSLGNFTTVRDLIEKGMDGETIRLVLLSTHYRKPLDFNEKAIEDAKKTLDKLYNAIKEFNISLKHEAHNEQVKLNISKRSSDAYTQFLDALLDDMNTPLALAHLYTMAKGLRSVNADEGLINEFTKACSVLGICQRDPAEWFAADKKESSVDEAYIQQKIAERAEAKKNKDFTLSDKIRDELSSQGIILKDTPNGTEWEVK